MYKLIKTDLILKKVNYPEIWEKKIFLQKG